MRSAIDIEFQLGHVLKKFSIHTLLKIPSFKRLNDLSDLSESESQDPVYLDIPSAG